ncbi:hypothetical protein Patl1_30150 [Pistacia atlantica]|uniref:Uncharacterized protein n=1 Tax=Pistacia atlantica TaxID=434234 RepID=A0ACC1AAG8_9ROSI|nr:hypothetical protein Patl1_30150 [Pistacia atlantica]
MDPKNWTWTLPYVGMGGPAGIHIVHFSFEFRQLHPCNSFHFLQSHPHNQLIQIKSNSPQKFTTNSISHQFKTSKHTVYRKKLKKNSIQ